MQREGGAVCRQKRAYPIYDETYKKRLAIITRFLRSLTNLQMIECSGLHKHNNQVHSMLTAILAVENIFGATHHIRRFSSDRSYQEESVEE